LPSTKRGSTSEAGDGGKETVVIWSNPLNVTINVGKTVVWRNPSAVGEPHTVTFIRQESYFAALGSSYLIQGDPEFTYKSK
jgi:plastocyanin